MNPNDNHDLSSANSINTFQPQNLNTSDFTVHPTPPLSSNSSTDSRMFNNLRRTSLDAILSSPTQCGPFIQQQQHRRDSTIGSSFNGSADSDELDDRTFSPIPTSATPVSTSSLLQMESFTMSSLHNKQHPLSPEYRLDEDAFHIPQSYPMEHRASITPTRYDFPSRPRRRREMQAITKIVETREYPYIDGYFWKNNGNTVQKKTGNKSVYYKCSNSTKGCPVNKTVTWKENGEYLIKYRGEHLTDCNKVQRIVDV
ncbi:hypothetical protein EDC96DRAFT_505609 [Choanephora cucurbitarum]|nr:hypothetical protein EDC96DRAFT_505609 [Choanephora cucurbitarum]